MRLRRQQEALAHWLAALGPLDPPPGVLGAARLDPRSSAQVYLGSILGQRLRALKELFPVCDRLLGDQCFAAISEDYLRAEGMAAGSLSTAGDAFPAYVADEPHLVNLAYLADLCHLELAVDRAWRRPMARRFPDKLATLDKFPPDEIVLRLADRCTSVRSDYPVDRIWRENQPSAPESMIDLRSGGGCFVIWRDYSGIRIEKARAGFDLLAWALRSPTSLLALAETCLTASPEFDLPSELSACVSKGWIEVAIAKPAVQCHL